MSGGYYCTIPVLRVDSWNCKEACEMLCRRHFQYYTTSECSGVGLISHLRYSCSFSATLACQRGNLIIDESREWLELKWPVSVDWDRYKFSKRSYETNIFRVRSTLNTSIMIACSGVHHITIELTPDKSYLCPLNMFCPWGPWLRANAVFGDIIWCGELVPCNVGVPPRLRLFRFWFDIPLKL